MFKSRYRYVTLCGVGQFVGIFQFKKYVSVFLGRNLISPTSPQQQHPARYQAQASSNCLSPQQSNEQNLNTLKNGTVDHYSSYFTHLYL